MALLTLSNAHLAFGHVPLLDGTSMSIETGERVALIGRNGAGQSSLLKILAGIDKPDDGVLQTQTGLRRVYVPQEPFFEPGITVFDAVGEGVAEARDLRQRYQQCATQWHLSLRWCRTSQRMHPRHHRLHRRWQLRQRQH